MYQLYLRLHYKLPQEYYAETKRYKYYWRTFGWYTARQQLISNVYIKVGGFKNDDEIPPHWSRLVEEDDTLFQFRQKNSVPQWVSEIGQHLISNVSIEIGGYRYDDDEIPWYWREIEQAEGNKKKRKEKEKQKQLPMAYKRPPKLPKGNKRR